MAISASGEMDIPREGREDKDKILEAAWDVRRRERRVARLFHGSFMR